MLRQRLKTASDLTGKNNTEKATVTTVIRYWWQNYVCTFFNATDRSPISQSCHQHKPSPISVINIDVAHPSLGFLGPRIMTPRLLLKYFFNKIKKKLTLGCQV